MSHTQTAPLNLSLSLLRDGAVALVASCLIALASQIYVTFPFTAVPFTLQPQAVLLLSALLGPKRALLAVACYLTEGAMGAPVFAGGKSGAIWFFSHTGGYLLSYLPVSLLTGYLFSSPSSSFLKTYGKFLLSNSLILALGTLFLSLFVGPKLAWQMGFWPFLATDALKALFLTALYMRMPKKLVA
ncbi:MAG: BioY protein [Chlamydiales bacterium]|jgi:biotin transport system substrate-specific component|nr:BioY protein [Chlamydiales bacterium]